MLMAEDHISIADAWRPTAIGPLDWIEADGAYFLTRHDRQHVVSPVGVMIVELANGRHTVAEIVSIIKEAFGLADPPAGEVRAFLVQAIQSGLVERPAGGTHENSVG